MRSATRKWRRLAAVASETLSDGLAVIYLADARQLPIVICHGQDLTQ